MIRVGGSMLFSAALAAGCGSRPEADSEASSHRTTPDASDEAVPASGPDDGAPQGNDGEARPDGLAEFDGGGLADAGTEGGIKYKLNPDAGPIEQCGTLGAAALAFSASNSGLLAVGHADGLVTLRNEHLDTTREIQADQIVEQLALSLDGKRLATVSADPEIRLWSTNDGSRIGTLAWPRSAPYDWKVALSFSSDDLFLLATALSAPSGDSHRNTTLFDLATGKIAWTRTDDWQSEVSFVDAGAAVLVTTNGDVKVYGRVDGQVLRTASVPALASTLGLVPSPDGSFLATGGVVVSTSDFQQVHQLGGGSPVFSADSSTVALTQLVGMSLPPSDPPQQQLSFRVADWTPTPAWSWPDPSWWAETVLGIVPGPSSTIAVIDIAGRISLIDPLLGVTRATTPGRGPRISTTLRFSHDGSLLASLGGGAGHFDDDALVVWDVNQQKVLWSLNDVYWETPQLHPASHAFAFSADDKTLFVISSGGTVRVLDALTGRLLRRFGKNVSCVATSPDGAVVYTCGNDVSAVAFAAYRVSDGSLVSSVDDQLGRMSGIAVSPQGTYLGMALRDGDPPRPPRRRRHVPAGGQEADLEGRATRRRALTLARFFA